MKWAIAFALALAASTSAAKDVTIVLNDREQAALREILNIATKAGGLDAAPATIHFDQKLKAAQQAGESKDGDQSAPPK